MIEIVKLEEVTPTASGVSARTGNAWQKNEIVVLTTGDWQKRFRLTCFGDVCAKAAAIEPGTMVQVQFSIEQREIPAKGDRAAFWVNDVNCHGMCRSPCRRNTFPPSRHSPSTNKANRRRRHPPRRSCRPHRRTSRSRPNRKTTGCPTDLDT